MGVVGMKETKMNGENQQKNAQELDCELRLYIYKGSLPGAFGIGVAELLHGVRQYGSLYKAAESMGMAYSKAWRVINQIEKYLGFQMLIRQVGRGCGSHLTERGATFLKCYDAFLEEMTELSKKSFKHHFAEF